MPAIADYLFDAPTSDIERVCMGGFDLARTVVVNGAGLHRDERYGDEQDDADEAEPDSAKRTKSP